MVRERVLKIVLVILGLFFTAGIIPLVMGLWRPSGSEYAGMMLSIYVTLGIFLLLSVRNTAAHRSLIAFAAWSSFAHAATMAVQATHRPEAHGRGGLIGGTILFVIVGVLLIAFAPRPRAAEQASATGA